MSRRGRNTSAVRLMLVLATVALLSRGHDGDEDGDEATDPRGLPVPARLQDCVEHALRERSAIEESVQHWQAALQKVPQVSALPDPVVEYAYYAREIETRVGPQRHRLAVTQPFPWPGTLRAREEAAVLAAEVARYGVEATRLSVRSEVAKAFCEYRFLLRSDRILSENLELLRALEETVRTGFRAGGVSGTKLATLEIESEVLDDRLRELRSRIPTAAAALNRSMGRDPRGAVAIDAAETHPVPSRSPETLRDLALERNPRLLGAVEDVRAADARIAAVRAGTKPELGFGVNYIVTSPRGMDMDDNGKDAVMIGGRMTLPVRLRKNRAAIAEAGASRQAAAARRNELRQTVEAALVAAGNRHEDAARRVANYRDNLIPRAAGAFEIARQAFTSGTMGYADMIELQRHTLNFQLSAERAETDRLLAVADLEMLTGTALFGVKSSEETKEQP